MFQHGSGYSVHPIVLRNDFDGCTSNSSCEQRIPRRVLGCEASTHYLYFTAFRAGGKERISKVAIGA